MGGRIVERETDIKLGQRVSFPCGNDRLKGKVVSEGTMSGLLGHAVKREKRVLWINVDGQKGVCIGICERHCDRI
jgi:hypothetical protein